MLTDFVRDHSFTIAWFGLMTMVWLGWAQEAPPKRIGPAILGIGSGVGILLAVGFGVITGLGWRGPTALEGLYPWMGVLVAAELVVAVVGAIVLTRTGRKRWIAWWVGIVVALHFLPLAWLLQDLTIAIVGVLQAIALLVLLPRLRRSEGPTSTIVGPLMGFSLLGYALQSAIVYLFTRVL